jgi:hypothetical protein
MPQPLAEHAQVKARRQGSPFFRNESRHFFTLTED